MGRCMAALKERFPGKMDFGKASGIVKTIAAVGILERPRVMLT